ncbi:MAG: SUF system Fe-S cluster assembly protein [Gammaproteobacteria bacterium]|nr:SUF system Fe-S cluster assembly protein [Gammaproteobacteria bacterium]
MRLVRQARQAQTTAPEQNTLTPTAAAEATGPITEEQVIAALRTVFDPEIPVNIYDLGLIYGIQINAGEVLIDMTLTAPACPVAGTLPRTVEAAVQRIPGVASVTAQLVWDPPWTQENLSEEARLELGML